MPAISVIIPAYNSEKTIQKTINSVLGQNFTDLEVIVINDDSQDSTLDIVSQFNDSRLKIFSYPHGGGSLSRNRGFSHAVGEFVSFLDADDLWTLDKLKCQLEALQRTPTAMVAYSWTDYIDESDRFLCAGTHITANGDVYEQLLIANFLENGSNPLIRREAFSELGGFDESLPAGQDWDMWLRLAARYHFVAVPAVQIFYRVSANSLSSHLLRQEQACLQVLEKACQQRKPVFPDTYSQSVANIYKYLVCKSLQAPLHRQKGFLGAIFLWKFFINDRYRFQRTYFTFKLLFKIMIILILPSSMAMSLLTSIKTAAASKSY
jgi:glycosyltransferase involved in cell wall biosynthesis